MSKLDLTKSEDNLRAFVKARASLDPARDVVTWFTGNVHAWIPGGKFRPFLLGFEGYNVARAVPADGGFDLLTREAVFYKDPFRGQILERFANPFTERETDVVHVWNAPVNQQFRLQGPRGPWMLPLTGVGEDVYFNVDVLLAYPSPLTRAEFPDNSQNDLYQAAELFQFFCKRSELEDASLDSASCQVSWTRLAPWLPWMEMGDREGQLVYHCRGRKLDSWDELPAQIREYVEARDPSFKRAPETFTEPNETSWTYFKKLKFQQPSR